MKRLFLYFVSLLSICVSSIAQNEKTIVSEPQKEERDFLRFSISYNPFEIEVSSWIFNLKVPFYGVSAEYMKSINAGRFFSSLLIEDSSKGFPLYLELGTRLNYGWVNQNNNIFEEEDNDLTVLHLGMTIPVNIAYRIEIPNYKIALFPFAGVNTRVNMLWGSGRASPKSYYFDDYFTKDNHYKRFQWGYQLGANLEINNVVFGIQRVTDLNNFYNEKTDNDFAESIAKLRQTIISFGVRF